MEHSTYRAGSVPSLLCKHLQASPSQISAGNCVWIRSMVPAPHPMHQCPPPESKTSLRLLRNTLTLPHIFQITKIYHHRIIFHLYEQFNIWNINGTMTQCYINQHFPICPSPRILGTIIAVVLLLAFVERPSSLSISSDPRHQSNRWEPPCGAPESVEMLCLFIFCLDLAVKVKRRSQKNFWEPKVSDMHFATVAWFFSLNYLFKVSCCLSSCQSYLIGWEEFRKSKWLISYTVVICVSVVDWVLSVSMECDEVRLTLYSLNSEQ